jgi:hypothetical protein
MTSPTSLTFRVQRLFTLPPLFSWSLSDRVFSDLSDLTCSQFSFGLTSALVFSDLSCYLIGSLCPKSTLKSHCDWWSVSRSVSLGVEPQIFIAVWQLRSCFYGAPSLARGRVCLLYMLLALASAVFLGSESLGTRDHILQSQIWDFPFCRLLGLAGSRWRCLCPVFHLVSYLLHSDGLEDTFFKGLRCSGN